MPRRQRGFLKWFIYLLVAMMIFSAVGVMVMYLNVPQSVVPVTGTGDNLLPTGGQQLITIPSVGTGRTTTGTTSTGLGTP